MQVSESVRFSLDHLVRNETEPAMLHACNAIDGTARKAFSGGLGNRQRFELMIRENLEVLAAFISPGLDLVRTRFPVETGQGGGDTTTDIATLLYKVHRCTHGHGDELPDGYELAAFTEAGESVIAVSLATGRVRLPVSVIPGLLAIAVLAPENTAQKLPYKYHLWCHLASDDGRVDQLQMPIHDWWGKRARFAGILAEFPAGRTSVDLSERRDPGTYHLGRQQTDHRLGT